MLSGLWADYTAEMGGHDSCLCQASQSWRQTNLANTDHRFIAGYWLTASLDSGLLSATFGRLHKLYSLRQLVEVNGTNGADTIAG